MSPKTSLTHTTSALSTPLTGAPLSDSVRKEKKAPKQGNASKSTARLPSGHSVSLTNEQTRAIPTPVEANRDLQIDLEKGEKKKKSHKPCFIARPFIWVGKAIVTVAKAIASVFKYIFSDTYEDDEDYGYDDDLELENSTETPKAGGRSRSPENNTGKGKSNKSIEPVIVFREPQPNRSPTITTILPNPNRDEPLKVQVDPASGLKRCRFAIQFDMLQQKRNIDINQFLEDVKFDRSALEQAVNHFSLESCENLSTIQHLIKEISSNHQAVTDLIAELPPVHQDFLRGCERAYESLKTAFKDKLQAHAQQAIQLVQQVHDQIEAQGIDHIDNEKLKHHYNSLECLLNHREQLRADGIDQVAVDRLLNKESDLFKALELRVTPLIQSDKRRSRSSSVDHSSSDNPMPGINNIGNSCYINSTIQVLESCPKLIEELRRPIKKEEWVEEDQFAVLELYQNAWVRLFDAIEYIRPQMKTATEAQKSTLRKVLEGEVWRLRNVLFFGRDVGDAFAAVQQEISFHRDLVPAKGLTSQHDAAFLLEGLADLNKLLIESHTKRRARIDSVVYERQSPSTPLSRVLQTAIPQHETSLQKIIEREFGYESVRDPQNPYAITLSNESGDRSSPPLERRTSTYLQRPYFEGIAPAVFPLQLKRFSFNREQNASSKNQAPIELPEDGIVDLSFAFDTPQKAKYRIVGCVSHLGSSLGSGHYTSYVRQNGKWRHYDDATMTSRTWEQIRTEAKKTAYILMLEKIDGDAPSRTQSPRAIGSLEETVTT